MTVTVTALVTSRPRLSPWVLGWIVATLAWLPQETILFDRARVLRRIDIDLAESASLLLCEIVVFGRSAMGERMLHGEFVDRWRMRRGGRLVFAETVRLDGDIGEKLARPAIDAILQGWRQSSPRAISGGAAVWRIHRFWKTAHRRTSPPSGTSRFFPAN